MVPGMKRLLAALAATFLAMLTLAAMAPPASAEFTENTIGCSGHATVTDKGGQTYQIDAQDKAATLPRGGSAEWAGTVQTVTHDHSGEIVIKVGPSSIKIGSWANANAGNKNAKNGTKSLSALEQAPPGKYELTGFHQGKEGRCAGRIAVTLAGSPLSSPVGIGVLIAAIVTALGWLMALRGHPILGAIAGLLLGVFATLAAVLFKALGSGTPLFVILPPVLLVLGVILGLVAPLGKAKVSAPSV